MRNAKSRVRPTVASLLVSVACGAACRVAPAPAGEPAVSAPASAAAASSAKLDPRDVEVPLPALAGWNGTLVLDQPATPLYTVNVRKVFRQFGCPEVVAIDDAGRCHVLWSYSGKWTPVTACNDGKWLGGIELADVDPRVPGAELYTGSQQGNLYELVANERSVLDCRLVATLPGFEVHTVVAADVLPERAGLELVVFTRPGGMYIATPRADGRDGFDVTLVETLPGIVRDALVLPARAGAPVEIATISRAGDASIVRWKNGRPEWERIFEQPMGMGRLALAPARTGAPLVLYSTSDDGVVRRHERANEGWKHSVVYRGPQGPRGLAAGRFDADPDAETIAVFGYSKNVELLTKRGEQWSAETLFVDRAYGHWLCAGELDGRNGTDELVGTGYSGRVFVLARPPGYGIDARGAAVLASPTETSVH